MLSLAVETACIICDTITYHLGGLTEYLSDVPDTLPLNKVCHLPVLKDGVECIS